MTAGDKGLIQTFDSEGFDMTGGTATVLVQRREDLPLQAHRTLSATINTGTIVADGVSYAPGMCAQRTVQTTDYPTGGSYNRWFHWISGDTSENFTIMLSVLHVDYQPT